MEPGNTRDRDGVLAYAVPAAPRSRSSARLIVGSLVALVPLVLSVPSVHFRLEGKPIVLGYAILAAPAALLCVIAAGFLLARAGRRVAVTLVLLGLVGTAIVVCCAVGVDIE